MAIFVLIQLSSYFWPEKSREIARKIKRHLSKLLSFSKNNLQRFKPKNERVHSEPFNGSN
jgi:hypothetical protein